eukprot:scaffold91255_cov75-Attheya_sp.AAC.2
MQDPSREISDLSGQQGRSTANSSTAPEQRDTALKSAVLQTNVQGNYSDEWLLDSSTQVNCSAEQSAEQ